MGKVMRSAVRTVCVAGCLMLFLSGSSFAEKQESAAEALFMKAMQMEIRNTDYEGAIKVYQDIIGKFEKDKKVAARAVYRMGLCYEKVGKDDEAKETFKKLNKEYRKYISFIEGADEKIRLEKVIKTKKDINALLERKSDFAYKEQQIRDIIADIAKRLGLVVFFEESLAFDKDGTASRQLKSKMVLFLKNSTYKEVLGIVLGNELAYRIEDNQIIIAREGIRVGKKKRVETVGVSKYISQLKKGTSYKERGSAVYKLCSSGNKSVVPILIEVLKDKSEHLRVRSTIAGRLWDLQDKSAISALLEVLKDKTENSRLHEQCIASLNYLARQHPQEKETVVSALIEALKDKNKVTRWSATSALGAIGDESAIPALRKVLKDEEIRTNAIYALGSLGDRTVIPLLIEMLENGSRLERMNAAMTLGRIGGDDSLEALKKACKKEMDGQVIYKIEEALNRI